MARSAQRNLPAYAAQLATLVETPPTGPQWLHELKLDGYRLGCMIDGGSVRLLSRRGLDWTASFPEVVAAAAAVPARDALIDGELVIVLPDGRTSFQALQNALTSAKRAGLTYFAFDLLYLDGRDLRPLPLEQRKEELRGLVRGTAFRYSEHIDADGTATLERACRLGAEGIISKRRDRPHRPSRTRDWLKTKCVKRQEFVIGGFTEPEGSRQGIGSMLLGYYDGSHLRFAGKVGTGKGFTAEYTADVRKRLDALKQNTCPFTPRPPGRIGRAHWVRPELVGEVQFGEWTEGGSIRHSSFLGFRSDKRPRDVTRETPERASGRTKRRQR